jgi:small subunit ribosomal protein S20
MKQNEKRRTQNRVFRGRARTFVKKARVAIESGDVNAAREATMEAVSALDKAAEKGVLHKNNASRRKSRLMKQLAVLEGQQS